MRNRPRSGYVLRKTAWLLFVAILGLCEPAPALEAGKGFETASINIGYMSQDELGARIDVTELADYIKKLQATCADFFADATTPDNLDIVVAVRANQQSRVWLMSSTALPDSTASRDQLRAKLEAVTPPKLSSGPIAFAIQGQIAGGVPRVPRAEASPTPAEKTYFPDGANPQGKSDAPIVLPVPIEWKEALAQHGRSLKFDELLPIVWPVSSAPTASPSPGSSALVDGFTIPQGIRYNKASDEQNQQAKQLLITNFTAGAKDADVLSLFNKRVICGPGLWPDIKNNPEVSKLTKGNVNLIEGTQKLEGKLFQSPDEILIFWNAFKQRTDFADLKIRKLNQDELKTYWAMISFDIVEPIFILESSKHKILVNFTPDEKILWIDDYHNFPPHL